MAAILNYRENLMAPVEASWKSILMGYFCNKCSNFDLSWPLSEAWLVAQGHLTICFIYILKIGFIYILICKFHVENEKYLPHKFRPLHTFLYFSCKLSIIIVITAAMLDFLKIWNMGFCYIIIQFNSIHFLYYPNKNKWKIFI